MVDLDLDFNVKVEKIYNNCIDNLLILTTRSPLSVPDVSGLAILAKTYLKIIRDLDALSGDEDEDFVGACSDDFICDECAAADGVPLLTSEEADELLREVLGNAPEPAYPRYGITTFGSPPAPLSDRDLNYVLNDMPPIILCGFGFSEN